MFLCLIVLNPVLLPIGRSMPMPSVADSLPLIPSAQIYTWDPMTGNWVARVRPNQNF